METDGETITNVVEQSELFSTNVVPRDRIMAIRDRILADGIPARSFAAGANALGNKSVGKNLNYADFKSNEDKWPQKDQRWLHSDIKNLAFIFNYDFFERIVKGEDE